MSNSCSSSKRTIEIPAVRRITGKVADEGLYAIGFRNRLLAIPLSVPAEACQVLFLFRILFFDARSLPPKIMIAWRTVTIAEGKRFPALPIAWTRSLPHRHLGSRDYFVAGKPMAPARRERAKPAGD